jgi:hypothetical protein
MEKRNLIKAILVEAVKRHLAEMPQIKKFYTLTDDWESKLSNVRGSGPRFQDIVLKMESLEDINHFNVEDIKKVFNIKGTGNASTFIKSLLQNGIIMPVEGAAIKAKDLGVDIDDEFTVTAAPTSDLTQGIDLTQALRKIKIDDKVNKLDFSIAEDFTVELPREEERRLAVQYGSVEVGIRKEFGPIYSYPAARSMRKLTSFRSTKYGFLKPFLEKKQYLKIPGESVSIQKYSYQNRPKITDLFPTLNDFFKFVQENPKSFKVTVTPKNFEEIKQKIESVGGKLVPTGEIATAIYV